MLGALTARGSGPLAIVDLGGARLSDADVVAVARHAAVFNAPHLRTMVLSDCRVGVAGLQKLVDGLVFTNLSTLRIENNALGDAGASALAMCLGSTSKLVELHVERNFIGDVGGSALARALVANCSLRSLFVSANSMGEASGGVFANVLSHHNTTLLELDGLRANTPGVHDVTTTARLGQALERNKRKQLASQFAASGSAGGRDASARAQGQVKTVSTPSTPRQVLVMSETESDEEEAEEAELVEEVATHAVEPDTAGLSDAELALFRRIQAVDATSAGPAVGDEEHAARRPEPEPEPEPEPGGDMDAVCDVVSAAAEAFASLHGLVPSARSPPTSDSEGAGGDPAEAVRGLETSLRALRSEYKVDDETATPTGHAQSHQSALKIDLQQALEEAHRTLVE